MSDEEASKRLEVVEEPDVNVEDDASPQPHQAQQPSPSPAASPVYNVAPHSSPPGDAVTVEPCSPPPQPALLTAHLVAAAQLRAASAHGIASAANGIPSGGLGATSGGLGGGHPNGAGQNGASASPSGRLTLAEKKDMGHGQHFHEGDADSPVPVSTDSASGDLDHAEEMVGGSGESSEGGGGDAVVAVGTPGDAVLITCGLLRAHLHLDKFMCPGIHQACIEYAGEFYTPKQFTVVAAKDKQKDWKGSIKVNRVPMRTLMERKQIDFWNHETYCSGKCASKNYRALFKDGAEMPPHDFATPSPSSLNGGGGGGAPQMGHITHQSTAVPSSSAAASPAALPAASSLASQASFLKALGLLQRQGGPIPGFPDFPLASLGNLGNLGSLLGPALAAGLPVSQAGVTRLSESPNANTLSSPKMQLLEAQLLEAQSRRQQSLARVAGLEEAGDHPYIHSSPSDFWTSVHTLGMIPELVEGMAGRVKELSRLYVTRPDLRGKISEKLSAVVGALELEAEIGGSLENKRRAAAAESASLSSEIEELRRRTEEQRRKAVEAKRKAQIFDHLLAAKLPRHSE